jgi:GNAT superfamily N-acetyltransferase
VDTDAARVDVASAWAHRRWMELLRDVPGNPLGVEVRVERHVVATAATAAPEVRWMHHVVGATPADADLVAELLGWYTALGVSPRVEAAPAEGWAPLADALQTGGLRQTDFADLLVGEPAGAGERPHASHVRVRRLPSAPDDAFARTLLTGHEVPADAHEANWQAAARFPTLDGYAAYLAEDAASGEPLGAALLTVGDGVGLLANASTVPAARGRGVQAALIARRIADANEAGCDVVGGLARPWSTSQRNMRRGGLRVACTKVQWSAP